MIVKEVWQYAIFVLLLHLIKVKQLIVLRLWIRNIFKR